MNLTQALNDYCIWHRTVNHSQRTIAWYQHKLGLFHAWLVNQGRSTRIDTITLADAREFILAEQQRTTKYPKHPAHVERLGTLSDRTIDSYVRTIRAFWRWLHSEEYVSRNVMAKLKRPKLEQRYKDVLSPVEVEQLLAACNQSSFLGARMYCLLTVMFDCGLRAGEVVALDVQDVDMHQHIFRVRRSKSRRERLVPFSIKTAKALRKYLVKRAEFMADEACEALFVGKQRDRMVVGALTQVIKRHGVRVGIPRVSPHLFRHSFVTQFLINGGNTSAAGRIAGHSSIEVTDGYAGLVTHHLTALHAAHSPMRDVQERRAAMPRATKKR